MQTVRVVSRVFPLTNNSVENLWKVCSVVCRETLNVSLSDVAHNCSTNLFLMLGDSSGKFTSHREKHINQEKHINYANLKNNHSLKERKLYPRYLIE